MFSIHFSTSCFPCVLTYFIYLRQNLPPAPALPPSGPTGRQLACTTSVLYSFLNLLLPLRADLLCLLLTEFTPLPLPLPDRLDDHRYLQLSVLYSFLNSILPLHADLLCLPPTGSATLPLPGSRLISPPESPLPCPSLNVWATVHIYFVYTSYRHYPCPLLDLLDGALADLWLLQVR
ncbi:hypothetical protein FIBSPDRAFT_499878 [Athelia psychrophila]|uniref:Uncharacterized protein n=1 Tax=Athelia psychrophila TaxID=1759441 RepID=A0A166KA02_9AGAM|nr:hypothetical protein FIBSPDRAFT_499878 [Fibularhizoctonia sp. CBS 109695]